MGFTGLRSYQVKYLLAIHDRLFKIRRTPFQSFTFLTFGNIFNLTLLKEGLHFDFPAARTKEFLSSAGCTGIFTGLSHTVPLLAILWLFIGTFSSP